MISFYFLFTPSLCIFIFFFNDTATTEIYTLSLHDALPICRLFARPGHAGAHGIQHSAQPRVCNGGRRSEEHTSELQSRRDLVCRLLLEKKKKKKKKTKKNKKNKQKNKLMTT